MLIRNLNHFRVTTNSMGGNFERAKDRFTQISRIKRKELPLKITQSRYMAKKPTPTEQIPTELIKDRLTFKQELEDRIKKGEAILNMPVNNNEDFTKMKSDYLIWTDYNNEYLKHAFNHTVNEYRTDYDYAGFGFMGSLSKYPDGSLEQKKESIGYKLDNLRKLVGKADLLKSSISAVNSINTNEPSINRKEVFIVHGHDEVAETKTARFIEQLGFKAIILHEQASSGKTIIEKIEEYSNVGFGIVLYTPCDLGGKTTESLRARARQNVVFEHGYLMGKIGRNNVCALIKGEVETPNDMAGVVYVKMDNDNAWHIKIAKELKSSGYMVDMNKI